MKKIAIIFFLLFHYTLYVSAQWEAIEMEVLNNWGLTTKVDALNDDGSFFFYGATPVDTNGQPIINGALFSTYIQGVVKNRALVNNPIYSVVEYQGDTILAGAFHTVYHIDSFPAIQASIERVLVLNNGSMQQLGSFNASCRAKGIGDDLYIFGWFNEAMGDSCNVIKWNGGQWEPVGPPLLASHHEIRDITFFNDELYIAGNILMDNGIQDILVLRNGEWQVVGEPIQTGMSAFTKLVVYNEELYAAGMIRKLDGFAGNMIQRWNGEIWQEVGNSLYPITPSSYGHVWDMKVHNDYLYVSGDFYTAGGIDGIDAPGIARWDGSQWCGLYTEGIGSIDDGIVGVINSFAFTGGELYVREPYYGIPAGNPAFIHRYTMGDEVFPCSEVFTDVDYVRSKEVSIAPNPCIDHFYLEFQSETNQFRNLDIYSITGQRVKSQPLTAGPRHTVDVSGLDAGMYVVQIMDEQNVVSTTKLVVQGR